ncbi:glutathione-disulfide reductase [Teredinibacter sp. KSP-S5-2]|uniref:glutathione-disulfide reductase n=1 Tax=Teredinibacter sp. KSP-S5-2 TaxID=3034506 RepID=UPI002934D696|nr:glutathione-disulfide reductase [Teredinibacter sp. KSP-S5-2]WNO07541.1 glutathione-disulfide reductase [Teredinibacter sp. KSP-S5-2]
MGFDYDYLVIGAGSGGVRSARIAASLGAKVAIIEDLYLGGTCVNVGCVPKKLFVYASEFSEEFAAAQGFGWSQFESQPKLDWAKLRDNKSNEIQRLNGVYEKILASAGVEIISGTGVIQGAHDVKVGDRCISSERILIATGGWPKKPSYPGAEYVLNSNDFFYMQELPKKVIVEGGGYIAVEFAGILNGLGCDTELVYRGPLFLRGFDQEIRQFVAEEIQKKGVKVSFEDQVIGLKKNSDTSFEVSLKSGRTTDVNAVVSAIGREPKIAGLGLENTNVKTTSQGFIQVNDSFQTDEPSIYAVGDVIGRAALTPVALAEGMALAKFLFAKTPINIHYDNIATAVFCQPNIGTVGLTEEDAEERGIKCEIFTSNFKPLKNTLSGIDERTFMKLIVEKSTQKVLGAHMVGPHAGEIIQGISIAINAGATKEIFDQTIGIHPTAAEEFVTMRTPTR